ncbi:hypothetical protein PH547_15385 [Rhizobium sp. CNPSo 3464]|nr:hypothetical protein [Rhizobium sp. CNPSo 3464]MDK4740263.1 hypothetical protein [Rhizobium sp. CNPSo 3464]
MTYREEKRAQMAALSGNNGQRTMAEAEMTTPKSDRSTNALLAL